MERSGRNGEAARHPIGVVAKRTGVSLHVLRAWERRYGVVEPERTPGGQRLYSDADVVRLRLLKQATDAGRPIGQIAALTTPELLSLIREDVGEAGRERVEARSEEGPERHYVTACLEAAERMDAQALHAVLMRGVVKLRPRDYLERVVGPLLEEVGERWHAGRLRPAQEHLVSVAVRRVLGWLLETYEPSRRAPTLLATTVSGEQHEFGAMLAAVVGADEGWRVVYVGPSLPAAEIAEAARHTRANAVALSAIYEGESGVLETEVAALQAQLPESVVVLVGGRAAVAATEVLQGLGATAVPDLDGLRAALRAIAARPAA